MLSNVSIQDSDSVNLTFEATTKAIILKRTPSAEAALSTKHTKNKPNKP
jgi:frataxin-like iron-binding protein CyaY